MSEQSDGGYADHAARAAAQEAEAVHPAQEFTPEQAAALTSVFQAFQAGVLIPLQTTLDGEPCVVLTVTNAVKDTFVPVAVMLFDGLLRGRFGAPAGTEFDVADADAEAGAATFDPDLDVR